MKGHIKKRGDRYYAVIYEGRDPGTGKERRSWHPAGADPADAERLAAKLAATETARVDAVRSLTFGAYLTSQWLPAKKLHLATSTYCGYLLIKDGIPVKVVSERLGHANIAFTMQTYQHVLPGMQADAAAATERLAKPALPPEPGTGERRGNPRRKTA